MENRRNFVVLLILATLISTEFVISDDSFPASKMISYREKVRDMFYHAYNGYLQYAYPYDELKPLTCSGMDTWGSFSLTLVDALDTLIILGNYSEFDRASKLVLQNVNADANVNVSVFETNIRVIGGLISAHLFSGIAGVQLEDGWPCYGPLLTLAERMASKLLPAFNTHTGMPYGTVNLRYGVHRQETPITCTAGVGTFLLEFGALSRLTGNDIFEKVAHKAMQQMWLQRSSIGLIGNHINVQTGLWTATDSGIGAGVDSYFEYLAKAAILFDNPEWMRQFKELRKAIEKYMAKADWFVWVSMTQGQVTMPIFQSLEAFWPGVLTLVGDVDQASRILLNYYQIVKQYGFLPESYNIYNGEAMQNRGGYPLRPEFIESLMYLYRATKDPAFLQIGAQIVDAIESSTKTKCGYATVRDVKNHMLEDRMESFFLAETTKYLFLLFDENNFMHNPGVNGRLIDTPSGKCVVESGGYVFNTEAHPIDPSMLYCCDRRRTRHNEILAKFENNIDLAEILGLLEDDEKPGFDFTPEEFGSVARLTPSSSFASYEPQSASEVEYSDQSSESDSTDNAENESGSKVSRSDDTDLSPGTIAPSARKIDSVKRDSTQSVDDVIAKNSINFQSSNFANAVSPTFSKKSTFGPEAHPVLKTSTNREIGRLILAQQRAIDGLTKSVDFALRIDDVQSDYCSPKDYYSNDPNLDALLNAVYSRNWPKFGGWAEKVPKIGDDYSDARPFVENFGVDDVTAEDTVSDLSARTFRNYSRQSEYHFELMRCKARKFTVKASSGLGAVAPSSALPN